MCVCMYVASKLYKVNATIIIFVFVFYCILLYCIVLYVCIVVVVWWYICECGMNDSEDEIG